MYNLYSKLLSYGNVYPLNIYTDPNDTMEKLKKYEGSWLQYNPNKDIKRYGLSLINHSGELTESSDLNTLQDKTKMPDIQEDHFDKPTEAYCS